MTPSAHRQPSGRRSPPERPEAEDRNPNAQHGRTDAHGPGARLPAPHHDRPGHDPAARAEPPGSVDCPAQDARGAEEVQGDRRGLPDPEVDRAAGPAHVRAAGQDFPGDGSPQALRGLPLRQSAHREHAGRDRKVSWVGKPEKSDVNIARFLKLVFITISLLKCIRAKKA